MVVLGGWTKVKYLVTKVKDLLKCCRKRNKKEIENGGSFRG